jgi:hypothetical protein
MVGFMQVIRVLPAAIMGIPSINERQRGRSMAVYVIVGDGCSSASFYSRRRKRWRVESNRDDVV